MGGPGEMDIRQPSINTEPRTLSEAAIQKAQVWPSPHGGRFRSERLLFKDIVQIDQNSWVINLATWRQPRRQSNRILTLSLTFLPRTHLTYSSGIIAEKNKDMMHWVSQLNDLVTKTETVVVTANQNQSEATARSPSVLASEYSHEIFLGT